MHSLLNDLESRHARLLALMELASFRCDFSEPPGERRARSDRFLAEASRHTAATAGVLIPAAQRRLKAGPADVRSLLRESRRLERALLRATAKQSGQSQMMREPWARVWSEVGDQLVITVRVERRIAAMLSEHLTTQSELMLRARFAAAVESSQTRPHPNVPHRGIAGRLARFLCSRLDSLWDELQGRITSAPRARTKHPVGSIDRLLAASATDGGQKSR